MNDHIRQAGKFLMDTVQESARRTTSDHHDDGHREGFTRAAGITLRRIQEKLDVLKEQMRGTSLTKVEQAVYAELDDLKSEIEADFDRYWQGSGVEWRPLKPVVKKVIRQTGESQSED
ncbi:hypothetical protein [Specibacter sp. RAF43]|uniref:hypothetical protein n=1 Tax=Specibacter sp. RAF43 TaxID=3233057 RepID=UPI003F97C64F